MTERIEPTKQRLGKQDADPTKGVVYERAEQVDGKQRRHELGFAHTVNADLFQALERGNHFDEARQHKEAADYITGLFLMAKLMPRVVGSYSEPTAANGAELNMRAISARLELGQIRTARRRDVDLLWNVHMQEYATLESVGRAYVSQSVSRSKAEYIAQGRTRILCALESVWEEKEKIRH